MTNDFRTLFSTIGAAAFALFVSATLIAAATSTSVGALAVMALA
ncbi:MAG: hypothetical protein ACTS1Z_05880 [Parasphingopyxis sp.]